MTEHKTGDTHFGFRTVRETEKAGMVRDVFDSVATKYDLMNDLMSGGVHRLWKNQMMTWLDPKPGQQLLDVGGGTGDIAFRFLDRVKRSRKPSQVSVCDINHEMLKVGRDRAIDQNRLTGINWLCGDAETLPLPDQSVDLYTIAFCIRNVTHIDAAVREAHRVLRPGGRFMCLEFSHVAVPVLDKLYDTYSFNILPMIGQVVAQDRESYKYLAESIRRFPSQEDFADLIFDAGFDDVEYRNLTGGIAAIHSAWRD